MKIWVRLKILLLRGSSIDDSLNDEETRIVSIREVDIDYASYQQEVRNFSVKF